MKTPWIRIGLMGLCGLAALSAQAHQVWLAQAGPANTVLSFGEFSENLHETSPGLLDKFVRPSATLVSPQGERQAVASKSPTGFVLPFVAGPDDFIVAEEASYPLYSAQQGGKAVRGWYYPAARLVTSLVRAQEPRLALDLVPTGMPGEFRLFFKGQFLEKTKVTLSTPSGWSKEARSDGQGRVRFDMPWKGIYVAEVSHTDKTAGERRTEGAVAESYDQVSYVTSLSYVKPDGLDAIPAASVAESRP